jgi:hypothetical protein
MTADPAQKDRRTFLWNRKKAKQEEKSEPEQEFQEEKKQESCL